MPKTHPKDTGLKFARVIKTKRKAKPVVTMKEADIQSMVEQYLGWKGVERYIRFPDMLWQYIIRSKDIPVWIKKDAAEYLKGMMDLVIPHPTLRHGKYMVCLPLEMKTEAGALSKFQEDWKECWDTVVTHNFDDAIKEIDEFLAQK